MHPSTDYDTAIIGGGIVGLAAARALLEREPGSRVVLLEKEPELAAHQSGHNSGVIHSGIYYQPGSLKARLCREGELVTKQFCRDNAIPFHECGKLLVATSESELRRMQALAGRAQMNGIAFEYLDRDALLAAEPLVDGLGALRVPTTGIVDYRLVCRAMAGRLREAGCAIRTGTAVSAIREEDRGVRIETGAGALRARRLVACAGLQADRVARMAGLAADFRIVPFRGEYYVLPKARAAVVQHLIYPIPDPDLPFLGIHLTRTVDGGMTVGPNAVLGFSREGYPKGSFCARDVREMAVFPGFWRMAARNWRTGLSEFANSLSRSRFLAECRKYCPTLLLSDLASPAAGIRAQAVMRDGTLVHDFLFSATERMLHVCNAPSPAATSAIPIGRMIVDRLLAPSAEPLPGGAR